MWQHSVTMLQLCKNSLSVLLSGRLHLQGSRLLSGQPYPTRPDPTQQLLQLHSLDFTETRCECYTWSGAA